MAPPSLVGAVKLASHRCLFQVNNSHDASLSETPLSSSCGLLPSLSPHLVALPSRTHAKSGVQGPELPAAILAVCLPHALLFAALRSIRSIVVSRLFASLSAFFLDSISRCRLVPTNCVIAVLQGVCRASPSPGEHSAYGFRAELGRVGALLRCQSQRPTCPTARLIQIQHN